MGRLALAAGAAVVAALLGVLLVKARAGGEGGAPSSGASSSGAQTAQSPVEPGPAPARAAERTAGAGADDSLPTGAEEAEARARVKAERPRPSYLSPDLDMNHKLTAVPLRDARKAYQRGEYEVSLARAQDALAVDPESNAARVLATLSACALGRPAVAKGYAAKLDDMRRKRVASRCEALGVVLDAAADTPAAGASGEAARPTSGE
jgi:hypothetical protein